MRHPRWAAAAIALLTACGPRAATGAPAGDAVVLNMEIEALGQTLGLSPVELPEASGGVAAAFGNERTGVAGGVQLDPGDYTLLLRTWAPAGDQDGFFVEIAGERQTRRTAPQQQWTAMAWPFRVDTAGVVSLRIIGQEPGMAIDRVAVLRGTYKDKEVSFADLPDKGEAVTGDALPRLSSNVALAEVPAAPLDDEHTLLALGFDGDAPGASGEHRLAEGRRGQGIYLGVPDGKLTVDLSGLDIGPQGTVEYWVKPRPAQRLWHDQGWHHFLFLKPTDPDGFQLDLSRHPRTNLRLTASRGGGPYEQGGEPRETASVRTDDLELDDWHHVLVSWDLTGERQYLWLLVDGVGVESFFPATYAPDASFSALELANTPSSWEVPFLPVDGTLDDVSVRDVSVRDRLADTASGF